MGILLCFCTLDAVSFLFFLFCKKRTAWHYFDALVAQDGNEKHSISTDVFREGCLMHAKGTYEDGPKNWISFLCMKL